MTTILKCANAQVQDLLNQYGMNATAFLTLYSGFSYFLHSAGSESGVIAFAETSTSWVGAAEPIGPSCLHRDMLLEFGNAAAACGKTAVILPANQEVADLARSMGFYAVQIGSEPWFKTDGCPAQFPATKQLQAMGAVVEAFDPARISADERAELQQVTDKWLESRKCATLSFLNRVEPWALSENKRYFRLKCEGSVEGFIAAVPVPARNAWYLVDLIRSPDAPAGTTELLVAEAMKALTFDGAKEVTLGMSPLAPVTEQELSFHPWTYRVMGAIFEQLGAFYGFKSLYNYKAKFRPQRWESCYLIALSPSLDVRSARGLFQVMFPTGVFATLKTSFARAASQLNPSRLYSYFLSEHIVPLRAPRTAREFLGRSWVSLALAAVCLVAGQMTLSIGMVMMVGLYLELVAGSKLLATVYSLGVLLALPLNLTQGTPELITGNPLVYFTCIGAWLWFVRMPQIWGGVIGLGLIGIGVETSNVMALYYIVSVIWGYSVAKRLVA